MSLKGTGTYVVLSGAAAVVAALVFLLVCDNRKPVGGAEGSVRWRSSRKIADVAKKSERKIDVALNRPHSAPSASPVAVEKPKPRGEVDDGKLFDEVINELIQELTEAVKTGDREKVVALLAKLRKLDYGVSGSRGGARFGSLAKRRILEALSEGGALAIDQIVGMLDDPDPSVVAAAKDAIFDSLHDFSLGDYGRAEIVTAAARGMTDKTSLRRLYEELIFKMRPTVAQGVVESIAASGTKEARELLPQAISAYSGDRTVTTPQQFSKYVTDIGGDPPDSDKLFGPREIDVGGK